MKIEMTKLKYATNALEPVIGQQTVEIHFGKHFQNYVDTLKRLVEGTEFEKSSVEEIVRKAPAGPVFNNAGQLLNHAYYFDQFKSPVREGNEPEGKLREMIDGQFGSFDDFKKELRQAAASLFGSGWAWLSQDKSGKLVITQEKNGGNPAREGNNPVLAIDVWEHAYYLDYQNKRADHVDAVWSIIDWDEIEQRLK